MRSDGAELQGVGGTRWHCSRTAQFPSIEDLRGHDTQLLNVATVEGIDVTRKLALAQEELGVEVTGLLGRLSAAVGG